MDASAVEMPLAVLPQSGGRRVVVLPSGLELSMQGADRQWVRARWIPAGSVAAVYRYRVRNWNYLLPTLGGWVGVNLLFCMLIGLIGWVAVVVAFVVTSLLSIVLAAAVHKQSWSPQLLVDCRPEPITLDERGPEDFAVLARWVAATRRGAPPEPEDAQTPSAIP